MRMAESFALIAECCARKYGSPFPQRMLYIGTPDAGWYVRLNPTNETLEGIAPFTAHVTWGGLPAGIIDAGGGIIAAGEAANEDTLCEWLELDVKTEVTE